MTWTTHHTARMRSVFVPPGEGRRWLTPWAETTGALLLAQHTGGAFTASHLAAPPGWRRPAYVHHHVDECFYVAAGRFEVTLDDRPEVRSAEAGAVVYVPRGVARSLCNVSGEQGSCSCCRPPVVRQSRPPQTASSSSSRFRTGPARKGRESRDDA